MAGYRRFRIILWMCIVSAVFLGVTCSNNLTNSLTDKILLEETEDPIPGGYPVESYLAGSDTVTLYWYEATDEQVEQADLEYKIVYDLHDSSAEARSEEDWTVGLDWTADISSGIVSGLTIKTKYDFNVFVRDIAGNTAEYGIVSPTTDDDITRPSPGGSTGITITKNPLVPEMLSVTWVKGYDDFTLPEDLMYLAVYSTTNNINSRDNAINNGTPAGDWTADIDAKDITNLLDNERYYVNVLLRDGVGLIEEYGMKYKDTDKHPRIYFTETLSPDDNLLARTDLDSPSVEDLATLATTGNPFAIAVDPVDRKIYWVDSGTDMLQRSDFDGENVEDLITQNLNAPYGIAIDSSPSNRYLYWTDSTNNTVYRSTLPPDLGTDTNSYELLNNGTNGVDTPYGIEVDMEQGYFFWVEGGATRRIRRAETASPSTIINLNLGGSDIPVDIAVDGISSIVYWTDLNLDYVRSNSYTSLAFTGSISNLITGLNLPRGITIDIGNGEFYWCDAGLDNMYKSPVIPDSGSDASNYIFLTGLNDPSGIQIY